MASSLPSLHVTGVAVGGDGLARDESGRVVLVAGALPGEEVRAEVVDARKGHARAVMAEVLSAAPARVVPPCPRAVEGCGGCGWQHVAAPAQRDLKVAMVEDALRRLGGLAEPVVGAGPVLPATGYRTTVRGVAGPDGRVGLRRYRSHDLVAIPDCQVADPLVAAVLAEGRFPPGAEVTVRAGARTGERLVVVDGVGADGVTGGDDPVIVPEGVRVVTGAELDAGKRAWLHEEVAGRRLRVSARSFFQSGPAGAEALVAVVGAAAGPLTPDDHLVDLYGGVGLFAATLAGPEVRVTLVESSPSAAADARVNLRRPGPGTGEADGGGPGRGAAARVKVVRGDVARWRPRRATVVVADPPRAGLGRGVVRSVVATGAPVVVLVSCDAGALGRDTALLTGAGYRFTGATLVDQFVGTPHVEVVSRFERERR